MPRILWIVIACSVLFGCAGNTSLDAPVRQAENVASKIIGTWVGPVTEGGRTTYNFDRDVADVFEIQMEMKIERLEPGEYAGKTTYSGGLNCGALNTFREKKGDLYVFSETINSGRGCANGRVEVHETDDGKLRWEWFRVGRGGNPTAYATLNRRN